MKRPRLDFVQIACIVCLGLSSTVGAHENLSHRHGALTVRQTANQNIQADLMVTHTIVGQRARLLMARSDLDRNGRFSNTEAAFVGRELQKESLGGLVLICNRNPLAFQAVRYKASRNSANRMIVAYLFEYMLPETCVHTLHLKVNQGEQKKGLEVLPMVVNALAPIMLTGEKAHRFVLMPGNTRVFLIQSIPKFDAKPTR